LPAALAAAAGLAALAGFVLIERASPCPLLDLGLFRSRIFTGSVASAVANYVSLFVIMLLLPFYLIEGLGLSAQRAGLVLSVQPLLMALAASPSGWLSDRIGSRALATAGLLVSSAGMLGLASLGPESTPLAAAGFLAVVGFGTGVFISPNSSALMGAAPRHRQGTAGSVLGEARSLGMLLGVALATAVFASGGGRTGSAWRPADFAALRGALTAAAVVGAAGAAAAGLRGRHAAGLVED
jgi:MFS family permease